MKLIIPFFFVSSFLAAIDGSDGSDGSHGYRGLDGKPITATATGQSESLKSRGEWGGKGGDGGSGGSATCFGEESGKGGDGGDGGNGGDGGDGGSLTAYFSDVSGLQKIQFDGTPGGGGKGGSGGSGGMSCGGGLLGSRGQDGRNGDSGNYGRISLIPQLTPIASTQSTAQFLMTEMEKAPFLLSANNWERRKGARALFAPSSKISDDYDYFLGRTEVKYALEWKATKPLSQFTGKRMALRLEKGKVSFSLPSHYWIGGQEKVMGDTVVFTFETVLLDSEAANIKLSGALGVGSGLVYHLDDKNGVSLKVSTQINVEYLTKEKGVYKIRFKGAVPPDALVVSADRIDIAVGRLAIDPKYLGVGVSTLLRANIKRSLGKKAMQRQLTAFHIIK